VKSGDKKKVLYSRRIRPDLSGELNRSCCETCVLEELKDGPVLPTFLLFRKLCRSGVVTSVAVMRPAPADFPFLPGDRDLV
jgi:hypothetical protein